MKVVGLTGGIGMGKSASAALWRERGAQVVDTDILARQVVEPGQPALGELQNLFGAEIIGPDGCLRRDEVARRAFADPVARQQLERILHPRIRDLWRAQVEIWRTQGCRLALVVIPLLFETEAQKELDATVCVACSAATQQERLLARGWTPAHIQLRLAAQWSIEDKIAQANFVIWSEGGLEVHAEQIDRILRCLG